ncbi:hypothetical protein K466DRAFT_462617, partial [Polyporus arcularius HHB13444]
WITETLRPYYSRMRVKNDLDEKSYGLLLIDVWPVHIAKSDIEDFLPWIRRTHPEIIIIFVLGGCTGIAQPADVGLQRLFKHHVKRSATDFVVTRAMQELAAGVKPEDIKLPTKLPVLRNASIAWLLDAYN